MDITLKSSKDEIVDSAVELIDSQADKISHLTEEKRAWIVISAILFCTTFIF